MSGDDSVSPQVLVGEGVAEMPGDRRRNRIKQLRAELTRLAEENRALRAKLARLQAETATITED